MVADPSSIPRLLKALENSDARVRREAADSLQVYDSPEAIVTPGSANQVVTGVAGTTWTDTTAPGNVTVYYVVRAENDETCGGGPNNGGLIEGNLVYAEAIDVTGQPPPGDVGDTLGDKTLAQLLDEDET